MKVSLVSPAFENIEEMLGGSVLEEESYFKMLGLTFSSGLDWNSCIISVAEITSCELGQLVLTARCSDGLHDFSVGVPGCYKRVRVNSFFPCTAELWGSPPLECFPLTFDLSGFKSRINRHLLTVGSF